MKPDASIPRWVNDGLRGTVESQQTLEIKRIRLAGGWGSGDEFPIGALQDQRPVLLVGATFMLVQPTRRIVRANKRLAHGR